MSLQAWVWEEEDRASLKCISSLASAYQSTSEYEEEEEYPKSSTAQEWDSDDQYSSSLWSSERPACTFSSDVPQVVPCKLIISLAFPVHNREEVQYLVLSQRRLSTVVTEKINTVPEEVDEEFQLGDQEKSEKHSKSPQEPETSPKNSDEYEKSLKTEDLSTSRRSPAKTPVSLAGTTVMEIKELIEKSSLTSLTNMIEKQKSQIKRKDSEMKRKTQKRGKKYQVEEETESKLVTSPRKPCVFSIQLSLVPLLAGRQMVISRGSEKSANILDCLLTLNTEVPIMTEEQKKDLNPLTIKIKCASCLPSQPVAIHDLERLCTPVYCRYQFHKTPVHETKREPHGIHVYFQDINVIFLGAMHPSDLREYLEGPPMVVEVHDRDRKSEDYSRKPTLFGEDPVDSYFNIQSFISPRDTENNSSESQNKLWDPYGIARVSFADLLLGHKYLNLVVPIHNCEPKSASWNQDSRNRKVVGFRVPTDVLQHGPMPRGNYMEANSLLKLRVDIAVPLCAGATAPELDLLGTQFSRIIFVFNSKKLFLLNNLLQDITRINAKALDLESYPTQSIQQILSAFRVRVKIQKQQNLDVLTGFHLLDGKIHLFILEGLADHGLKRLWESYQSSVSTSDRAECKVLYDSRLLFRNRLYADLETLLYHVHLFMPMSLLLRHPALYVRGAVPRKAFQALIRIYDICHNSTRLKEVIVRDLLPSSSMVKDLSQEFGVPISKEELIDKKQLPILPQPAPNLENFRRRMSTLTLEINVHQEKYQQWRDMLQKKQDHKVNLIQKNITEAYRFTKKPPKSMVKTIRISIPVNKAVHNYSIQTLNSTELAKKKLYQEMAKEWKEKELFANILKPVLDRERWSWSQRHLDFELYKKPPPFLEVPPPPAPKPKTGRRPKANIQSSEQHGCSQVTAKPPSCHGSVSGHPQGSPSVYDNLDPGTLTHQATPSHDSPTVSQHPRPPFPSCWLH